jgi:hypothetical protein
MLAFLLRCGAPVAAVVFASGVAAQAPTSAPAPDAGGVASPWSAPEPWRTDRFYLQTSLYTVHFHPDPNHVNQQNLINVDYRFDSHKWGGQWLAGVAIFDNSFGQPSQYVYGGWLARPFESAQPFYFKITAGVLNGYKPPYDNKIPFNDSGVAPGIVPSFGYCYHRFCSELVLFGTAGAMLTLGATLP